MDVNFVEIVWLWAGDKSLLLSEIYKPTTWGLWYVKTVAILEREVRRSRKW